MTAPLPQALLAEKLGGAQTALPLVRLAVAEQTSWPYDEPPDFFMPLRQCLGQLLLRTKDFAQADAVFRADLADVPRNAFSLFGLLQVTFAHPLRIYT
jgi:hypothetical protein